jgi:hypothetical protein
MPSRCTLRRSKHYRAVPWRVYRRRCRPHRRHQYEAWSFPRVRKPPPTDLTMVWVVRRRRRMLLAVAVVVTVHARIISRHERSRRQRPMNTSHAGQRPPMIFAEDESLQVVQQKSPPPLPPSPAKNRHEDNHLFPENDNRKQDGTCTRGTAPVDTRGGPGPEKSVKDDIEKPPLSASTAIHIAAEQQSPAPPALSKEHQPAHPIRH